MYCNKCKNKKKVNIINNNFVCITCIFINEIKRNKICNYCDKIISNKDNWYYKSDNIYCSNLCRILFKN